MYGNMRLNQAQCRTTVMAGFVQQKSGSGSHTLEQHPAALVQTVTDSDAYFSYLLGPIGLKFHGFVGLTFLYVLAFFLSRSSREALRKELFSPLLSFHSCTKSNSL